MSPSCTNSATAGWPPVTSVPPPVRRPRSAPSTRRRRCRRAGPGLPAGVPRRRRGRDRVARRAVRMVDRDRRPGRWRPVLARRVVARTLRDSGAPGILHVGAHDIAAAAGWRRRPGRVERRSSSRTCLRSSRSQPRRRWPRRRWPRRRWPSDRTRRAGPELPPARRPVAVELRRTRRGRHGGRAPHQPPRLRVARRGPRKRGGRLPRRRRRAGRAGPARHAVGARARAPAPRRAPRGRVPPAPTAGEQSRGGVEPVSAAIDRPVPRPATQVRPVAPGRPRATQAATRRGRTPCGPPGRAHRPGRGADRGAMAEGGRPGRSTRRGTPRSPTGSGRGRAAA